MKTTHRPAAPHRGAASRHARAARRRNRVPWVGGGAVAVLGLLFLLFLTGRSGSGVSTGSGISYAVATPATGAAAPAFTLPSTSGGTVSLAGYRGRTVLLFFQEGIGCEPCWTQIKDLETAGAQLQSAGVDAMLTITTNTVDQLRQKVSDEGLRSPVLSDPDFAVSHAYNANTYGMMGNAADGHTFVLVGPDGVIRWRADYGGPPDYTMYVPVDQLLHDMHAKPATS